MSENWVEGTYESGADADSAAPPTGEQDPDHEPDDEQGATLGQTGDPSTFEPEEDSGEGADESKAGS